MKKKLLNIKKLFKRQDPYKKRLFELKKLYPSLLVRQERDERENCWHIAIIGPYCVLNARTEKQPELFTLYCMGQIACRGWGGGL